MRVPLSTLVFTTLTLAAPTHRSPSDTSTDLDAVIVNGSACASNALIYARGTFERGNLGVWVGAPLKQEVLKTFNNDIHVQGVNRDDYPGELYGYIVEKGSESCADGCARTLDAYAERCPHANLFVSGWSQGALCAHKCVNRLTPRAHNQTKALFVFGSPNDIIPEPSPIPLNLAYQSYCNGADVLCTATLTSGMPESFSELIDRIKDSFSSLVDIAMNDAQRKAALKLPGQLLKEFWDLHRYYLKDIVHGNIRMWLVLQPHLEYELEGYVAHAAVWLRQQV